MVNDTFPTGKILPGGKDLAALSAEPYLRLNQLNT
jgi:hypothetical protein